MAPSRAATPTSFSFMLSFLLALLIATLLFPASAASTASPSPSASVDLICHTDDPSECYPKIFQPTEEFQTVHDDQDIPPNLHVRMNIWTGAKEARLNIPLPGEGEADPALAGLPVDRAVVVVEQEPGQASANEQRAQQIKPHRDAPKYDPIGKVKPPANGAEPQFTEALSLFHKLGYNPADGKDKTATLDGALEELRELSHDGYYGMMIMADKDAVKGLLCLMLPQEGEEVSALRSQMAAYVLAGALSNNPSAVKELAANWDAIAQSSCRADDNGSSSTKLVDRLYTDFTSTGVAGTAKARVSALNGMLENAAIRDEFLRKDGMRALLQVLVQAQKQQQQQQGDKAKGSKDEWEGAARRAGQLVLDRFLDEDMGAKLGVWPHVDMLGEEECKEGAAREGTEKCWRHVVAKARDAGSGDWSRELWERLGGDAGKEEGEGRLEYVEL